MGRESGEPGSHSGGSRETRGVEGFARDNALCGMESWSTGARRGRSPVGRSSLNGQGTYHLQDGPGRPSLLSWLFREGCASDAAAAQRSCKQPFRCSFFLSFFLFFTHYTFARTHMHTCDTQHECIPFWARSLSLALPHSGSSQSLWLTLSPGNREKGGWVGSVRLSVAGDPRLGGWPILRSSRF